MAKAKKSVKSEVAPVRPEVPGEGDILERMAAQAKAEVAKPKAKKLKIKGQPVEKHSEPVVLALPVEGEAEPVTVTLPVEPEVPAATLSEALNRAIAANAKEKAAKNADKETKAAAKAARAEKRKASKGLGGKSVTQVWAKAFVENEKAFEQGDFAAIRTDEQITEFMKAEFPGRESAVFGTVQLVRGRFNRGVHPAGTNAKDFSIVSHQYLRAEDGTVTRLATREEKKLAEAEAKQAAKAAKKAAKKAE